MPARRLTAGTLALLVLILARPLFAQDDAPDEPAPDLQTARARAIRDRAATIDKDVKPIEGEFNLHDLFTVRVDEHGFIKLTPNLPANLGPSSRLKVRGFDAPVRVDIEKDEKEGLSEVRFVVTNFNHAHAIVVESQVHWSPEVMVIDQMSRFLNGQNYVSLIQQDTAPDEKRLPRGVSLRVMLGDIPGQSAAETFEAESFAQLREKNWNEVEQYVRPILRELRLTSLLSVDPKLAWQVFAAEWAPQPKIIKQLEEVLPSLNAEDFKERRNATQKLKELGEPVVPAILKLDRRKLTPEQNTALDSVLASLLEPQSELTRLRNDPNFLADCLYSADPQIVRVALGRINQLLSKEEKLDPNATADQRAQVAEPLRRELAAKLTGQP